MAVRTINDIRVLTRRASPQPLEIKRDGLYSGDFPVVWTAVDFDGVAHLGLNEDDIELLCNARNWIDALIFKIECLQDREAEYQAMQYKWASIINRLACLALGGALNFTEDDREFAQDMIEMVNPYLGLDEE